MAWDERHALEVVGEPEQGPELGVMQVAVGHLVHDAAHGLRRVTEDLDLLRVKDLGAERPRARSAVIEGVSAGKVGIALFAALDVTSELARDGEELVLEVTAMK